MIVPRPKAQEAADVLGVSLDGITADVVKRAYRAKAKECHPDHHGQKHLQLWSRVSWAKECLERWVATHPEAQPANDVAQQGDCRACGGTGRVVVAQRRGFGKPLTMGCIVCNGVGTVLPQENDGD